MIASSSLCKAKSPYHQDLADENPDVPSLPPRAELPGSRDEGCGRQSADDRACRDDQHQRRCRGPSDRGEGFGEGRKPRRGLAAAELAALSLHAEPELDRGRRTGAGRDADRRDRGLQRCDNGERCDQRYEHAGDSGAVATRSAASSPEIVSQARPPESWPAAITMTGVIRMMAAE